MKKIISASIKESTSEKLDNLAESSNPRLTKSAIVDYAIQTVDLENFQRETNKTSSKNK